MTNSKKPIGVFDSGIGGLTVLEKLMEKFPNEDFIYVADQGHCPYGTKTEEGIKECVLNVGKYLIAKDVKAIVIACNTASLFIKYLQEITEIPVISVIEPTCMAAINKTENKKVAVLATIATINKGAYQALLKENNVTPFGVACSEFVDFVENYELTDPLGQEIVSKKLEELKDKGVDTLIHGCTHFSLLEPQMKNVLGEINYVACGEPTSEKLFEILKEKELLRLEENNNRYVKIGTTGSKENALMNMKWFKKEHEPIEEIEL